jgi:spore germination protein KB
MKEVITNKQGVSIIILFTISSSVIFTVGPDAKQDSWISILVATAIVIPLFLICSRVLSLYKGKNMFDICYELFGKILGRVIIILYSWFAFHLGSMVISNFSKFIKTVSLTDTPELILNLVIGLLCIWAVKDGIELLGRISTFIIPIVIMVILTLTALSDKQMNFDNIQPVLYNGWVPIFKSAFGIFAIPFAEISLFAFVFKAYERKNSPYRIYIISLIIGTLIMLVITVRNIAVLGPELISNLSYASYITISIIDVGDVIQRIEAFISVVFIFAGFMKISICLYAASYGTSKFFNIKNYRSVVAPVGLLMIALASILYKSVMEMNEFATVTYKFYSIPFFIIMPIVIYITAEIKNRKSKNKKIKIKVPEEECPPQA